MKLEARAAEGDSKARTLTGYAAVFNQWSVDMWGFRERIRPGAFAQAVAPGADVRFLWNHDHSLVLGRTAAGTLRLSQDDVGLKFELDLPEHELGVRAYSTVERGDVDQMSFLFEPIKDEWTWKGGKEPDERELIEVEIYEISAVTFPAYENTSVEPRSVLEAARRLRGCDDETRRRRLRLAETVDP